jgi:hypothetical protein
LSDEVTLDVAMLPQPDEVSCGPTALHAVYNFYRDNIDLDVVRSEVGMLAEGGTLAVLLATHALSRGYDATLHTFNLQLFDPTWFRAGVDIRTKLRLQREAKTNARVRVASDAYDHFIELGGRLTMQDLTPQFIREQVKSGHPVLAGTSGTYLLDCARELDDGTHDDVCGEPQGHFVLATGIRTDEVLITDPWPEAGRAARYWVSTERFVTSVLLGVLTYDGNLLMIRPRQ